MQLPKMHGFVACHVCPINQLCNFAAKNASLDRSINEQLTPVQKENLDIARQNCPLRKVVNL